MVTDNSFLDVSLETLFPANSAFSHFGMYHWMSRALYGRTEISEIFVANAEEYDLHLLHQNLFDQMQTSYLRSMCELFQSNKYCSLDRQKLDYSSKFLSLVTADKTVVF